MNQRKPFPPGRPPIPREPLLPPTRAEILRHGLKCCLSRFRYLLVILAGVILTVTTVCIYDARQPPEQHLTQRDIDKAVARTLESLEPEPSWASIAYRVIEPSVVSIYAQFIDDDGSVRYGAGSGFVVNEDGAIMTCLHVVKDSSKVMVVFADGFETTATIDAVQPENDLAMLRPDVVPADLIPAIMAGSAFLRVGDEVFAVGNQFGFSVSLTAGIVSGLGLDYESPEAGIVLTDLIQFDAAVNPGSSGGPLINRYGEVVGVVTAHYNPTGDKVFIGIGFASPIENVISGGGGSPPV